MAPKLASKLGKFIPPVKAIYMTIKITPTRKFENKPTVASDCDLVLKIQYKDQRKVLPRAKATP